MNIHQCEVNYLKLGIRPFETAKFLWIFITPFVTTSAKRVPATN